METVLYRLIQDYKREVDALALVVFYGSHYFFIPGLTFASILMFFFSSNKTGRNPKSRQ